jgi:enamine deaminase RidA (YjgF/YER057c/UK114 family)
MTPRTRRISMRNPVAYLGLLAALAPAWGCTPPGARGGGFPPLPQPEVIQSPAVRQLAGSSGAVKAGLTLYVSAQVALDSAGRLIGPDDLALQTRQSLRNLITLVRVAHGVPADVVKLTVYYLPGSSGEVGIIQQEIAEFFPGPRPPALTMIGVASLPSPSLRVAVEGIAQLRGLLPDRARDTPTP